MRTASVFGPAALVLTLAAAGHAAELLSGVEVGGKIGAYSTTKCGGIDDGVAVGKSLCYT
jgi:hypothetical protein